MGGGTAAVDMAERASLHSLHSLHIMGGAEPADEIGALRGESMLAGSRERALKHRLERSSRRVTTTIAWVDELARLAADRGYPHIRKGA
jgi:hypothetical protein